MPLVPEPEPEVPPFGQVIVTHTGPVSLINAKGVRVPPGRRVPVGRYEVEATFKKEGRLPTGVFIDLTPGDIEHVECFEEFGSCRIP